MMDVQDKCCKISRMALFVIIVETLFTPSDGFVLECKPLQSETLDGFYQFVSESSGYADVCPFVISGDGCKTTQTYEDGYVVPNGENLYISCDPYRREAKCIIDCPVRRHFTVSTGSSLTLESMILEGADSSAVYIEPQGQLTVFDSIFQNNKARASGNGGAIFASTNTILQVRFSEFYNNKGEFGGAILSLGEASIFQSIFENNLAEAAGGAVAVDTLNAKLDVDRSTFEMNEAANGGAIFIEENSRCSISYSTFGSNYALSGGAIENFGTVDIIDCSFMDNFSNSGGALNTGPGSSSNLRRNTFINNGAESAGPAVYDRYRSEIFERDNTACGNSLIGRDQECDGVLIRISLRRVRCRPFANECIAPTQQPSTTPTNMPSVEPSHLPSHSPSIIPTMEPSFVPSNSVAPSATPTTSSPSYQPTQVHSASPSLSPSASPSKAPSAGPSATPSASPSDAPSFPPSKNPSGSFYPSSAPSDIPTNSVAPSATPSASPSSRPSSTPSENPSGSFYPSSAPSETPSLSVVPNSSPSSTPSEEPSLTPSHSPTESRAPTLSYAPSSYPSNSPSTTPTFSFSPSISTYPSLQPTNNPSISPSWSMTPSVLPSKSPSVNPTTTIEPSMEPTLSPSISPTASIQPSASLYPSVVPSDSPSMYPSYSNQPSMEPTKMASTYPSISAIPTESLRPSSSLMPSFAPSSSPSNLPSSSVIPSDVPSLMPSYSVGPSTQPSDKTPSPTQAPSAIPTSSSLPSAKPSRLTFSPSLEPSVFPSAIPSILETNIPADVFFVPTGMPTGSPVPSRKRMAELLESQAPSIATLSTVMTMQYKIVVPNGVSRQIGTTSYADSLIESMDRTVSESLANIDDKDGKNDIVTVELPSSIAQFEEIPCSSLFPNHSFDDKCQVVTAEILLTGTNQPWPELDRTLEVAIAIGRLRFNLYQVDAACPVEIVDSFWYPRV